MSKKKKAPPKKATHRERIKPQPKAKAAKKAKPRERIHSPKSVPLPGMEQVTNRALNHVCECISDAQREMNRLIAEVDDLHGQAQTVMESSKPVIKNYTFSGVQLRLTEGTTKLSVRILKNKTEKTAKAEPAPADEPGVTAAETDEIVPAIHEDGE